MRHRAPAKAHGASSQQRRAGARPHLHGVDQRLTRLVQVAALALRRARRDALLRAPAPRGLLRRGPRAAPLDLLCGDGGACIAVHARGPCLHKAVRQTWIERRWLRLARSQREGGSQGWVLGSGSDLAGGSAHQRCDGTREAWRSTSPGGRRHCRTRRGRGLHLVLAVLRGIHAPDRSHTASK